MKTTLFACACVIAHVGIASASQIVPAQPTEFETVNLRTSVDSCVFVPSTVRVSAAANVIRVTQSPNACFAPGAQRIVDIRLGAFPVGSYRVELYASPQPTGTPAESLAFEVTSRPEVAVFPPPTRPLTDYTGMWWTPSESGWGLSLVQSPTHVIFGTWYVYGAAGQPEWFTLQEGRWVNFTTWTANVYRTSGPWVGASVFDARLVTIAPVGTATFDFAVQPGLEGKARFNYTLNGVSATKSIQRLGF